MGIMRNALYRAKDLDGNWVIGNYLYEMGLDYLVQNQKYTIIRPSTLCYNYYLDESSGIWENDIFEYEGTRYLLQYSQVTGFYGMPMHGSGYNCLINITGPLNVIGNYFDNPELWSAQEGVDAIDN